MGGIARLAKALGHRVSGSDANVYPPMSTQLEAMGIELKEGYSADNIPPDTDLVVIGNALSRGNPEVEFVLNRALAYTSGPQWLADNVLRDRWVLAVAGTHGKTTTSSMLAWILEQAGLAPGFLIGGVPTDFDESARLGESPFFVIEADEYDTAFFDKRSKFVHYRPRTLVLNNLEFDHADIFDDLAAIRKQFHHLIRTVPGEGRILVNQDEAQLREVMAMGCWSDIGNLGSAERTPVPDAALRSDDDGGWSVSFDNGGWQRMRCPLPGEHNARNALAAIAAARHAGVAIEQGVSSIERFGGVKRRMELRGEVGGVRVYDDFAHHPTAIEATIAGLRGAVGSGRILAVVELRSNSMRMGVHSEQLLRSFDLADEILVHCPAGESEQHLQKITEGSRICVDSSVESITARLLGSVQNGDHLLIMSNGGFEGLHDKVLTGLAAKQGSSTNKMRSDGM